MFLPTYQISDPTLLDTYRDTIGLQADASASWRIMVFANPPGQFNRDPTTFVHLSGLGTIKTNYRDQILIATYRDFAKTTPPRR
jgi:hypothetical protein